MTKIDARTSLSKCSTVSARISQNRGGRYIMFDANRFGFASNFLISSFVRRNSQDILRITIYLFLLLRLHVINCYMRAAVCIWLVLTRFTVSFPIPYKIVTIHRTLSEHTFLNT